MTDEQIEVETYDGHKGGEKPRKVLLGGKEYLVQNVLDSKRVQPVDEQETEEHFTVELETYGEAKIVYHHNWGNWTLEDVEKGGRNKKSFSDMFLEEQ